MRFLHPGEKSFHIPGKLEADLPANPDQPPIPIKGSVTHVYLLRIYPTFFIDSILHIN